MPPVKSIKLTIICGAVLGTSIVCSTAFAQMLNPGPTPPATPGPTPVPNSFPTPTPNPNPSASPSPSPAAGVQVGGVAIPVPVLNMAQYLPGGMHEDVDVAFLLLPSIRREFPGRAEQVGDRDSPLALLSSRKRWVRRSSTTKAYRLTTT